MATPFSDVYSIFLSNITDYNLGNMNATDLESNLEQWLLASIPYLPNSYGDVNNYDIVKNQFNVTLDNPLKQILGKIMILNYLNTQIFREEYLKQHLNSKDYKTYSPNEQLKTLHNIRKDLRIEIDSLISKYSYNTKNLKAWFGKNE